MDRFIKLLNDFLSKKTTADEFRVGFLELWYELIGGIHDRLKPDTRLALGGLMIKHLKKRDKQRALGKRLDNELTLESFNEQINEILGEEINLYPIRPFSKEDKIINEFFFYVEDFTSDPETLKTYSLAVDEDQLREVAKKALDELLKIKAEKDI